MFLVMCRVVLARGRTHICSQRKSESFFVQPGWGGGSHMDEQPQLTGFLDWWLLGFG